MLGKVLRKPEQSPAYTSLIFAHEMITSKNVKGRRGRHRKNLYDTILEDIKKANIDGLDNARDLATNSTLWENLRRTHQKRRSNRIPFNIDPT